MVHEGVAGEDWHLLEKVLVGVEMLVVPFLVDEFGLRQLSALLDLRLVIELDVPLGPFLHAEQLLDHALNGVQLFLGVLLDFVE